MQMTEPSAKLWDSLGSADDYNEAAGVFIRKAQVKRFAAWRGQQLLSDTIGTDGESTAYRKEEL